MRYGIPDFKLEKHIIERRLDQLRTEGVEFQTGVNVGEDISARYLRKMFDCAPLTMVVRCVNDIIDVFHEEQNTIGAVTCLSAFWMR